MTAHLLPHEPETGGLLALMLFCEARRHARRSAASGFIPIDQQDTDLWDEAQLAEAEAILRKTGPVGRLGRYQLEAAIQAVHAARRKSGAVDWPTILHLYEGLVLVSPSIGARVGRAAALASAGSHRRRARGTRGTQRRPVAQYQPYWATRAHVLALLGRDCEARPDYARAAGLTEDAAVREFLLSRRRTLTN
jgi:RNA polymerase sigma-70 factor (ECF subfamily)